MQSDAKADTTIQADDNVVFLHRLYQQHRQELCAYLMKKFRFGRSEAEDAVHIAFEKVISMNFQQLNTIKNHRAFLYKTTYNTAVDIQRHSSVGQRYVDTISLDSQRHIDDRDPYRMLVANQDIKVLANALKRMPEKRRKLIIMNRFDGLSYAEIARKVNLSETVVRKHITRALADCMQALKMKKAENIDE